MGYLVVLADGRLESVRSVLQDWSACELLDEFVWIDSRDVDGTQDAAGVRIRFGQLEGVKLQYVVAGYDRSRGPITLCALTTGHEEPSNKFVEAANAAATIARKVIGPRPDAPFIPIRVTVARDGAAQLANVAWSGWDSLVVAPQQHLNMHGTGVIGLGPTSDPVDVAVHAAAAIASLFGLWSGADKPTWTVSQTKDGQFARLFAGYFRRLYADEAEEQLRDAVLTNSAGLPRPVSPSGPAELYPNPSGAVSAMANQWWELHRGKLVGEDEAEPELTKFRMGFWEAIAKFIQFLRAALVHGAAGWLERQVDVMAAAVAREATVQLFGPDSAYEIVVAGRTADGRVVEWGERARSAVAAEQALADVPFAAGDSGLLQELGTELGDVWQDFTAAALTLVDGERRSTFQPGRAGRYTAVVGHVEDIAPPATLWFRELPSELARAVHFAPLSPVDSLGAVDLRQALDAQADLGSSPIDADRTLDELDAWRRRTNGSYAAQAAERMSREYTARLRRANELIAQLSEDESDDLAGLKARQRRIWRRTGIIGIVSVLLLAATVLLAVRFSAVWGIGSVVVLLFGFAAACRSWFIAERDVFQWLHRQRHLANLERIRGRNLRRALRDVGRLSDAYCQLLEWSRILAVFLTEPLGRRLRVESAVPQLDGPMPDGMRLGYLEPDAAVVAKIGAELRREVFQLGWLSEPWADLWTAAKTRVEPRLADELDEPQFIFYRAAASGSPRTSSVLASWTDALERSGTELTSGDAKWNAIRRTFAEERRADQIDELTQRIRTIYPDTGVTIDRRRFLDGMDAAAAQEPLTLDSSLLNARGNRQSEAVSEVLPATEVSGLGQIVVGVRISDGIKVEYFELAKALQPSTGEGDLPRYPSLQDIARRNS